MDDLREARKISPYDTNFGQHLTDHNIHEDEYDPQTNQVLQEPLNIDAIRHEILAARAFISPSQFTKAAFHGFRHKNKTVSEGTVMRTVIPIITGDSDIPNDGNLLFTNLVSLTSETTVTPVPDFFDGARAETIDKTVIRNLYDRIVPTKHITVPVLPNFFLESKGPCGDGVVIELQARYDGAHGSRAMQAMRSYIYHRKSSRGSNKSKVGIEPEPEPGPGPEYDGNAYTLSCTYCQGNLQIYAHHVTAPATPNGAPAYHMTQIGGWAMTGTVDAFRQGVTAFRNARDVAGRLRDCLIREANAVSAVCPAVV